MANFEDLISLGALQNFENRLLASFHLSVGQSFRPHERIRLQLDALSLNLRSEYFWSLLRKFKFVIMWK